MKTMSITFTRRLGRSDLQVSALGLDRWAIGGQLWDDSGKPRGMGEENVGAMRFGPLKPEQMREIDELLDRQVDGAH